MSAPAYEPLAVLGRGIREGDPAAFRALVDRTHRTVFRLTLALLSDQSAAADATQETYIKAWQGRERLRDDQAVLGWLFGIARNCAKDHRKSFWQRFRTPLTQQPEAAVSPEAERGLLGWERQRAVRAALAKLSEKHRVVLILHELDGETEAAIALALDLPLGTVTSRLHRARQAFARLLGPSLDEEGP